MPEWVRRGSLKTRTESIVNKAFQDIESEMVSIEEIEVEYDLNWNELNDVMSRSVDDYASQLKNSNLTEEQVKMCFRAIFTAGFMSGKKYNEEDDHE